MKKLILLLLLFVSFNQVAKAQYYTTGSSDVRLKWNQLKSSDKRLIFPDYYLPKAYIVEGYLDTVRNIITHGLIDNIDYIPIIMYPTKAQANGLVTWTPKRMELYTNPANGNYSLPWLKQLSIHEYRHVVQLSNLNRGLIKLAGHIMGQQAVGVSSVLVPTWFYEGDATLAETQLSIFGRGKQPKFSISTRALLAEAPEEWSYAGWNANSFKYDYPSIYELGYFITWAGQTFYSPDIWAEMMDYTAKRPVRAIFSIRNLKQKYGVSREDVANRAVKELTKFWEENSSESNSSIHIPKHYPYYEVFSSPILIDDSTVLAVRNNKSVPNSFVTTNFINGESKVLDNSVLINSRPILVNNTIYWCEYKPSLFWENNSYAVIKKAILSKTEKGYKLSQSQEMKNALKNAYFVTYIEDEKFAYINFDKLNNPQLIIADDDFNSLDIVDIGGYDTSVSTMDYDVKTQKVYLSVVDDNGISLIGIDVNNLERKTIKVPSHVTITDLRADNGKLYYSSTLSGKDEIHVFNLETKEEHQITKSKYGSFSPSLPFVKDKDSTLLIANYEFMGYRLALQKMDSLEKVVSSDLPDDKLVPSWYDWNAMKLDTVNITPLEAEVVPENLKKYRKFSHSFNPHSWIPLAFNPQEVISERALDINVGATALSQNVLGGVTSTIGYGYVPSTKMGILVASLDLTTLPVHFSFNAEYGGSLQGVYVPYDFSQNISIDRKRYSELSFTASLPTNFSDGRRLRYFTPFVSYDYDNSLIIEDNGDKINGVNKLTFGLGYQNYKYKSQRDLESPLGYYVSFTNSINPITNNFGKLFSLYGSTSLPGIIKHHSIVIKANLQYQKTDNWNYQQKTLYPRGNDYFFAPEKLFATSMEYKFPLWYPEAGIDDLIFLSRISLGFFGDYAYATIPYENQNVKLKPYTYGGEIMFDYTLLDSSTEFYTGISLFKPSERSGLMVGFSFNVAF